MDSTFFLVSYILLWLLVLFQTLVIVGLVQRTAEAPKDVHTRLEADQLPAGSLAPDFTLAQLRASTPVDSTRLHGRRALLGFVSPTCSSCIGAVEKAQTVAERREAALVVVCGGPQSACEEYFQREVDGNGAGVLAVWDDDSHVGRKFGVHSPPVFVEIDEQWRVERYGMPIPSNMATGRGSTVSSAGDIPASR
jgi:hypothetical protein